MLQGVSQGGPEHLRYNVGLLETVGQAVAVEIGPVDVSGVQTAVKRHTLPVHGRVPFGVSDIQSAVSTANASLVAGIVSGTGRIFLNGTQKESCGKAPHPQNESVSVGISQRGDGASLVPLIRLRVAPAAR